MPRASAPPGSVGCEGQKENSLHLRGQQPGCPLQVTLDDQRTTSSSTWIETPLNFPEWWPWLQGRGVIRGHLIPGGTRRKCSEKKWKDLGHAGKGHEQKDSGGQ